MQLTRAADYAVRVMIHLATLPETQRTLLPALANATGAPVSFLSKVLQALAHAELISSKRGSQGGFQILPRGRAASVRQVVEAIDGPISLNLCLLSGSACSRQSRCTVHRVWFEAQAAMLLVLDAARIGDLGAQPPLFFVASAVACPASAAKGVTLRVALLEHCRSQRG